MSARKLTAKQVAFVREYLVDLRDKRNKRSSPHGSQTVERRHNHNRQEA